MTVPRAPLGLAAALAFLLLAGCGSSDTQTGVEGSVKGFIGGVAVDEPRAALEGRRVLASGGSAVDAATTIYFALAATYPSAAGLGGGGVCVVSDYKSKTVQTLDFMPGRPSSVPPNARAATAVPGNPLGFFALHSRYGRLAWTSHVIVGERLARFGTEASRALARDVAAAGAVLARDAQARALFLKPDGTPIREGDFVRQIELSRVLSILRAQGPGEFYHGRLAAELVDAARRAGGSLTLADLRAYHPVWRKPIAVEVGSDLLQFADGPASARAAAALFAMLARHDAFADADPNARLHLSVEAAAIAGAAAARDASAPKRQETKLGAEIDDDYADALMAAYDPARHRPAQGTTQGAAYVGVSQGQASAATGFVTLDNDGNAVACSLTMNAPFGAGVMAPGTGMFLAAWPPRAPVAAAILANPRNGGFYYAAAAGGAPATASALAQVTARHLLAETGLADAVAAPRVGYSPATDVTHVEPGVSAAARAYLGGRGHRIAQTPALGRVNAIDCPDSVPSSEPSCAVAKDPRGFGLGLTAEE